MADPVLAVSPSRRSLARRCLRPPPRHGRGLAALRSLSHADRVGSWLQSPSLPLRLRVVLGMREGLVSFSALSVRRKRALTGPFIQERLPWEVWKRESVRCSDCREAEEEGKAAGWGAGTSSAGGDEAVAGCDGRRE